MAMLDPSLLDLFRAELETHVPVLSEGLLALEKDPAQTHRLEALMRAAHSLKGAAKIVGVEAAVQLAHAMEDCFVAAQEGQITLDSEAVDVLLRGVDALPRVVPSDANSPGEFAAEALGKLVADITAIRAGRKSASAKKRGRAKTKVDHSSARDPVIRPHGNLDAQEAEELRTRVLELLHQGAPEIQIDLAAIRDVAPAGLAVLALAGRAAAERRPPVRLQLANASPPVQMLLRMTHLDFAPSAGVEGL
jgi:two-component system sensor histidine kinase and response regulator WspE